MATRSMSACIGTRWIAFGMAAILANLMAGCGTGHGGGASATYRNKLNEMKTVQIRVKDQPFDVWLARTEDERERGLMQVTEKEMAATLNGRRGMLFVFPGEQNLAFWMFNTIIPLDIAYINAQGQIVKTYTMAPLETRTYPSLEPAQFALEVLAGTFEQLGIGVGDHVEIPVSVLKDAR